MRNGRGNTRSEEEEEKEDLHATSTEKQITNTVALGEPHARADGVTVAHGAEERCEKDGEAERNHRY